MTDTIVWVHGDCLNPNNPALKAYPNAQAIFVFDDAYLVEQKISLKRVMFMYESALELPVTIRRGNLVEVVLAFAGEHGATQVATTESVSPRFKSTCDGIRKGLAAADRLEIVQVEPFVSYSGRLDLRRFSRYWSAIRDNAMGK
ncbi:MAG: hypothetical protein KA401_01115 [Anaerolineae bacterium]|nr:hypothetical protein [Anaerolineae bacterium]